MNNKGNYRRRIYSQYADDFPDAGSTFEADSTRRWGRIYRHYLRGWLPDDKRARILDAACGKGNLLHFLKTQGFTNVCGIDLSKEQVKLARQANPDVVEADIMEFLESDRECFDLVAGLDIIEHFHKPEVLRFLDLCYAALRPGGRLILQTPNADSPWVSMYRYGDFTHEVAFNAKAIGRLMKLVGFKEIEPRETGPVPIGHSLASTVRYVVWRAIRAGLRLWNLAETGNQGGRVFTRVFLISGTKR